MGYLNHDVLTGFTASCGCTSHERCITHEIEFENIQKERKKVLLHWINLLQGLSLSTFVFGFGLTAAFPDSIAAIYQISFMFASLGIGIAAIIMERHVRKISSSEIVKVNHVPKQMHNLKG